MKADFASAEAWALSRARIASFFSFCRANDQIGILVAQSAVPSSISRAMPPQ